MSTRSTDSPKGKPRNTYITTMISFGVAIDLAGGQVAPKLALPLYMDSIGTAIVTTVMGPRVDAVSGVLYNVISTLISGNMLSVMFGFCSIATAFIIGSMAESDKFTTWIHAVVATILMVLASAIMGAPTAVVVYGGTQGGDVDLVVAGFLAAGQDILSAAFLARVSINLVDKGIACSVTWLILMRLPENTRTMAGSRKKMVTKNDQKDDARMSA